MDTERRRQFDISLVGFLYIMAKRNGSLVIAGGPGQTQKEGTSTGLAIASAETPASGA